MDSESNSETEITPASLIQYNIKCRRCDATVTAEERDAHSRMHIVEDRRSVPLSLTSAPTNDTTERHKRSAKTRRAKKKYDKAAHIAYKGRHFNGS